MKKKDKATLYYNIAHIICFLLIYLGSIFFLFAHVGNIFVRILGFPILFLVCGLLEEKVMVIFVNPIVWLFLPKEIRKKEMEIAKKNIKSKIMKKN